MIDESNGEVEKKTIKAGIVDLWKDLTRLEEIRMGRG